MPGGEFLAGERTSIIEVEFVRLPTLREPERAFQRLKKFCGEIYKTPERTHGSGYETLVVKVVKGVAKDWAGTDLLPNIHAGHWLVWNPPSKDLVGIWMTNACEDENHQLRGALARVLFRATGRRSPNHLPCVSGKMLICWLRDRLGVLDIRTKAETRKGWELMVRLGFEAAPPKGSGALLLNATHLKEYETPATQFIDLHLLRNVAVDTQ